MGVVSGVVMAYEFGTNWARFSDKAGAVIGPLMGYEVLTAFFLEAGFLGIMLFGRERVGRTVHFVATMLVAIGTLISAFWILAANSWMQTPQGHTLLTRRTLPARRLVADHLQSVVSLSPRAHGDRVVSVGRVRGGRGRCIPSAARRAEPGGAADVLDGDVDGRRGGADPDPGGRPARPEHAAATSRRRSRRWRATGRRGPGRR